MTLRATPAEMPCGRTSGTRAPRCLESAQLAQALLAVAAEGESTRRELCEPFPLEVHAAINELIDALEQRHLLADRAGGRTDGIVKHTF
jgi:hypothetical protein